MNLLSGKKSHTQFNHLLFRVGKKVSFLELNH